MKKHILTLVLASAVVFGQISTAQDAGQTSSNPQTENSDKPGTISRVSTAASSAVRQTGEGLADAAMSPLEDLNLRRDEIPPLLDALTSPYELPHTIGCYEISLMIRDLDAVLGPDWDAPKEEKRKWDERAASGAARTALNTVSSEASGLIPFRGVVRKLTRAEKHAKAYNRAWDQPRRAP